MSNLISKWRNGLLKTSKATFSQIASIIGATEISENTFDNLEALLIQADIGVQTSQDILTALRQAWRNENITQVEQLNKVLRDELRSRIHTPPPVEIKHHPYVILIVGVNGSGKTTTIAKLGYFFQKQGRKVLLGAADTYRAAAVDQLTEWATKLNIPIIVGQLGGDAAAVTYDVIQSAVSKNYEIVIIDTAGRLHTRYNLMEELKKVFRVANKAFPGAPHAVWLVLDATTGQNALQQAKAFQEAVMVNGVILAKLDSSAKGGMVFSIQKKLGLPVFFAGLGEKLEDFALFDADAFIDGILYNP